jgi:hypothetical protein
MSFKYSYKPFKNDKEEDEEEDENDSDVDDFYSNKVGNKGGKRKGHEVKKGSSSKKKLLENKSVKSLDVDDESDDDCVVLERSLVAKKFVDSLLAKEIADSSEDDEAAIQIKDDISAAQYDYRGFLSKSTSKLEGMRKKNGISNTLPTQKITIDSTLVLPRVPTAAERASSSNSSRQLIELSDDNLLERFATSSSTSSSHAAQEIVTASQVNKIKIKTRLLNEASSKQHMHDFKMVDTDKFIKLRNGISKIYNIDAVSITMIFDGNKLKDDQTAIDVDMEEGQDNMVDVKIPKEEFSAALLFYSKQIENASTSSSSTLSFEAEINEGEVSSSSTASDAPAGNSGNNKGEVEKHEKMTIDIFIPKEFTITNSELIVDFKVFKSHTLQSLHDMLLEHKSLNIRGIVSYFRATNNKDDDLDMERTFGELNLTEALRMRFKCIEVQFDLSCFKVEKPMDIKVRLNLKFSKAMVAISKTVECSLESLNCNFNGVYLDSHSVSTFFELGILNDSKIVVSRK